jgi:hypothetical protein
LDKIEARYHIHNIKGEENETDDLTKSEYGPSIFENFDTLDL